MLKSKTSNGQVNTRESQNFSDKSETIIASIELCVVTWDHRGKLNWFLGYAIKIKKNSIKIEHLKRDLASNNSSWRYPNYAHIQEVEDEQILPIQVVSEGILAMLKILYWSLRMLLKSTLAFPNIH